MPPCAPQLGTDVCGVTQDLDWAYDAHGVADFRATSVVSSAALATSPLALPKNAREFSDQAS